MLKAILELILHWFAGIVNRYVRPHRPEGHGVDRDGRCAQARRPEAPLYPKQPQVVSCFVTITNFYKGWFYSRAEPPKFYLNSSINGFV
jgi:hypothetical protein